MLSKLAIQLMHKTGEKSPVRFCKQPMSVLPGRPRQSAYGFNSHSPYLSTIFVFMLSIGRHTTETVT